MSGVDPQTPAPSQTVGAPDLRLRAQPPAVMRLSKKALAALGLVAGIGVGGALVYALQTRGGHQKPAELLSTTSRTTADGLATLPKDYGAVPKLGAPLPGDLGRPIVAAQAAGKDVPPPGMGSPASAGSSPASAGSSQAAAVEQARQQAAQMREAARTSKLFTSGDTGVASGLGLGVSGNPVIPAIGGSPSAATTAAAPAATTTQSGQGAMRAFLDAPADKRMTSADRLVAPASPYVVQAGSVIPAALITGLRSDLPGQITAQVTENVYDSPTGQTLLIPQGARLVGEYDSQVSFGQERVLLAWTRLILPDGRSITLERQPGADAAGYAGLEDGVDNHWGKLFKAAMLSTLLSVGAEAGTSQDENNLAQSIRAGAANSFSQTGQQIVEHELNIQPTLTVRPGFPVRVMVERDLVLEPYRAEAG
jgi:type IV secretion system protein VirB10